MNAEESYYILKSKLQKLSDDDHKLFSFIADLPRISNKVLRIARFFPGINTNEIKVRYHQLSISSVILSVLVLNFVVGLKLLRITSWEIKYEIENASSNYIICHVWKRAPKRRGVRTYKTRPADMETADLANAAFRTFLEVHSYLKFNLIFNLYL